MSISKKFEAHSANLYFAGVVLIAVLFVLGIGVHLWNSTHLQFAQNDLDENVSKTDAGRFAVENFTTCKKAGGAFSSPASDAQCITETVSGAEKLKGTAFSAQVTHELAEWLEQSNKLRANN